MSPPAPAEPDPEMARVGGVDFPASSAARPLATVRGFRVTVALLALLACHCEGKAQQAAPPPRPVEVGVVVLQHEAVLLTTELPGRTSAYETSEVRPQVSGIIRERSFTEGQVVKKGQTLYRIDARLYRASEAQARANLTSAEAAIAAASSRSERWAELAQVGAVSQQDAADAKASADQAAAAVEQARAALQTASINLQYTAVAAPITGRIGRSLVTTGALVTANQPTPLATIQRLDPIFVDMQQSTAEMLALRRSLSEGGALVASTDVTLELEDGTKYSRTGQLQFAEATVDPSTSAVTLRARFDNPEAILLPGMYVRALVTQAQRPKAILAPQAGIARDPKGNATALVVGPNDQVELRPVRTSRVVRDRWLVEEGLVPGDRLIVEGTSKVKPGQRVKPVPAGQPSAAPRPSPSASG
jgi:membrane fusion protein, multidrug efflux system